MKRDFKLFKEPVQRQFKELARHPMFRVVIDKDLLWLTYLNAFPPGTNEVFRQRREYDCSCCRQFIRSVGDVVAVINNKVVSVWDVRCDDPVYQQVADALALYVRHQPIDNLFLYDEPVVGTDKTFEQVVDLGDVPHPVMTWQHFFINLPKEVVVKKGLIGPRLSEARATHDVLLRSLVELRADAVETVLDLISQGSLYRGTEYHMPLVKFRELQQDFYQAPLDQHDPFVWRLAVTVNPAVARIRNTAIGTLLVDLSEGMELDAAVRRFEAVMAPANYKRPTALVTKKMIEAARAKLTELGLVPALERRYARLTDISVNNLLFVDRSTRAAITNDVFDELPTRANPASRQTTKVDEVSIEAFVGEVLPRVTSMEVLMENRLAPNLMSLVTAADATAPHLFKWDNPFSWSYRGDFADSVKERVKAAGGAVSGDLCCRLAWSNYDDLDLHMHEPDGHVIYFRNKGRLSPSGGVLDVDMNAGSGTTRTPVENIFYAQRSRMKEGTYALAVHQYNKRESIDPGFEVEFDYLGDTTTFSYGRAVRQYEVIRVATFDYTHARGVILDAAESLSATPPQQTVWGIKTHEFRRVNLMTLSPNWWDGRQVGNKHYLFVLDGCVNDAAARGFFNEFIRDELTPHRKVIEMVGARMRTDEAREQLSGLGFSSTQRNTALVRVKGAYTRTLKVIF